MIAHLTVVVHWVSLFLEIRPYHGPLTSELHCKYWASSLWHPNKLFFKYACRSGKCLLWLDGINDSYAYSSRRNPWWFHPLQGLFKEKNTNTLIASHVLILLENGSIVLPKYVFLPKWIVPCFFLNITQISSAGFDLGVMFHLFLSLCAVIQLLPLAFICAVRRLLQ